MEFIDHTGHIFSQPSFTTYPTGYEYETFKYVFYLEDEYARRLSVNEWYIRPVRFLLHKIDGDILDLSIKVDSHVFKLLGSKKVQNLLSTGEGLSFDEDDDFVSELTLDDIFIIEDNDDYLITFYVCGYTTSAATWTSNVLIYTKRSNSQEWCPITCGGVFYDECEELVINGKNMGVSFPKDIIHAIYPLTSGTSIYTNEVNEAVYNAKVKEYMMNYMRLHGECGNMDQMKDALKFFEWGDKITMSQLIRTDNKVITQYVKNFFTTDSDILRRMEHFNATALVSLVVAENTETGEEYHQDFNNDLWGEGKPVLADLFNKLVPVTYDNTDIKFYKPYYEYVLMEMMLKLACLRHHYQKWFLPMHAMVMSASVQHKVFANDIKYLTKPSVYITEVPFVTERDRNAQDVIFPDDKTLFAYTQKHNVDRNFNEFSNYATADLNETDIFYLDDVCVEVPIKFINKNGMDFFQCHLILERLGGPVCFESDFSFSQSVNDYQSFIIYPKLMNDWLTMNYWVNKHYCIHLLVNGIWYDWEFMIKVPEMHMTFGKLKYKYDNELHRQLIGIHEDDNGQEFVDFQSFMYIPSLIDVSNIRFPEEVVAYGHDGVMDKFVSMYREKPSIVSTGLLSRRYYNRVHYFKLLNENGEEIPYTGNQDDTDAYRSDVLNIYKQFFNTDGTQIDEYKSGTLDYDIYLMHDSIHIEDYGPEAPVTLPWSPKWYVVMISRQTIDAADINDKLLPPATGDNLKYVKSDNKWLINRMVYVSSHGINHFKTDDIIVGTINNVKLPFILQHGAKWKISPMSIGMQTDAEVESTTNTFLMSLGGDNTGYDPGYYNITVRYSLDGVVQNQREHKARILVER